jgi:hypothetical protein
MGGCTPKILAPSVMVNVGSGEPMTTVNLNGSHALRARELARIQTLAIPVVEVGRSRSNGCLSTKVERHLFSFKGYARNALRSSLQ